MKINKKVIGILLVAILLMIFVTGVSFALDFDSFGNTVSNNITNNTTNNTTNNATNNTTNNATNNITNNTSNATTNIISTSTSNSSDLPKTGSNTEIKFGAGIVALVGISVYLFKKSTIKLD